MTFLCQSCSIEMDTNSDLGTNEDGTKNPDYCNICFRNGKFTNPNLTLKEEIEAVTIFLSYEKKMLKDNAKLLAENTLPKLKRWRKEEAH